MQVRVFEAKDMTTGLKMVKEALGPDALILCTRTVRTGRLGVLGKPMLEITAAIDTRWPGESDRLAGDRRRPRQESAPAGREQREAHDSDRWPNLPVQEAVARPSRPEPYAGAAVLASEPPPASGWVFTAGGVSSAHANSHPMASASS